MGDHHGTEGKGIRMLKPSLEGLLWRVLTSQCCARQSIQIWKRWHGCWNAHELRNFLEGMRNTWSQDTVTKMVGAHDRGGKIPCWSDKTSDALKSRHWMNAERRTILPITSALHCTITSFRHLLSPPISHAGKEEESKERGEKMVKGSYLALLCVILIPRSWVPSFSFFRSFPLSPFLPSLSGLTFLCVKVEATSALPIPCSLSFIFRHVLAAFLPSWRVETFDIDKEEEGHLSACLSGHVCGKGRERNCSILLSSLHVSSPLPLSFPPLASIARWRGGILQEKKSQFVSKCCFKSACWLFFSLPSFFLTWSTMRKKNTSFKWCAEIFFMLTFLDFSLSVRVTHGKTGHFFVQTCGTMVTVQESIKKQKCV